MFDLENKMFKFIEICFIKVDNLFLLNKKVDFCAKSECIMDT